MNVLTVRSALSDNGPATQSLTIAKELTRRGHKVSFATSGGTYMAETERAGFKVHVLPTLAVDRRDPLSTLRNIVGLGRIVVADEIDVIHGHNAAATMCAWLGSRARGRRPWCVNSVRGIELRPSHRWRNQILRLLPGTLLAVCEHVRARILAFGVAPDKVVVTYNGVDVERFDPARHDGGAIRRSLGLEGKTVVGVVGAMAGPDDLAGPTKGQHHLVEALARLADRFPDLRVLLVGDGPRRAMVEQTARRLGVLDRVVFAGRRFDIPEILAAIDIYCQPSIWGELLPNAILEAMAMGKPWIGSDLAGLGELTADGEAGWVSPPGDVAALAANLERLVADPDLCRRRGARARAEVLARFTIAHVVDRILDTCSKPCPA